MIVDKTGVKKTVVLQIEMNEEEVAMLKEMMDCGPSVAEAVMEQHHLRPTEKDNLMDFMNSFSVQLNEIGI